MVGRSGRRGRAWWYALRSGRALSRESSEILLGLGGGILLLGLLLALLGTAGCAADARGRPWVHDLTFRGVKQVKAGELRGRIATEETSWIPLAPKKYLDHPFMLDSDRERIERYYQSRGFFGARVTATEVKPYKPGAVDVTITVDEGQPSRVTAVTLGGVEALPQDLQRRLRSGLRLRVGQIYDHRVYLADRDALERRLKLRSYAFAEVEGEVRVNRDQRTVEVLWTARPAETAVFGEVRVQGTARTSPADVARHAAVPIGAPFRPDRLDEAQGKLYNLGLFSTVKIAVVRSPRGPGVADIEISVAETLFREIRLGGGLGLESLRTDFRLRALYTQRNFLGRLRTLRLNAEPGYALLPNFWSSVQRSGPTLTLGGQLSQPDVLGRNSELRFSLGYDLGVEYAYQVHGPRTSLGLSRTLWINRVAVSGSLNFQFLDFFNVDQALVENPYAQVLYGFIDPYFLTYLLQDVSLDLRDRQLDARRGGYFAVNLEEGAYFSVGGALSSAGVGPSQVLSSIYLKLQPEVRGYLPLGSRVVLAARATFGQAFSRGDLSTPITRRFYLGGPNSHRGFNYNRLSLQVCSRKRIGAPQNTAEYRPDCGEAVPEGFELLRLPVGGDQLFLAQGEVRVSLFRLFKNWLLLAGFIDAGDVAVPRCSGSSCAALGGALQSVDFTRLHVAVGGGLRYQTIVGTVRADLGVRLNRLDPTEPDGTPNPDPGERLVFHISIGEAF